VLRCTATTPSIVAIAASSPSAVSARSAITSSAGSVLVYAAAPPAVGPVETFAQGGAR
jgi:hypothetical protein